MCICTHPKIKMHSQIFLRAKWLQIKRNLFFTWFARPSRRAAAQLDWQSSWKLGADAKNLDWLQENRSRETVSEMSNSRPFPVSVKCFYILQLLTFLLYFSLLYPKVIACFTEMRTMTEEYSKQILQIQDIQPDTISPLIMEMVSKGSCNDLWRVCCTWAAQALLMGTLKWKYPIVILHVSKEWRLDSGDRHYLYF